MFIPEIIRTVTQISKFAFITQKMVQINDELLKIFLIFEA